MINIIVDSTNTIDMETLYSLLAQIIIQNEGDNSEQDVCTD